MTELKKGDEPSNFCAKISLEDYEKQAADYTKLMIEQLNQAVRDNPEIGGKSSFFKNEENVKKGLPVFQGRHTRFLYDEEGQLVGEEEVPKAESETDDDAEPELEEEEAELYESDDEVEEPAEEEDISTMDGLVEPSEEDEAVAALSATIENTHIRFIDEED